MNKEELQAIEKILSNYVKSYIKMRKEKNLTDTNITTLSELILARTKIKEELYFISTTEEPKEHIEEYNI